MSGFVADSEGHTTSGPTITWGEYEGLLARLRELKAQAARDAAKMSAMNDALVAVVISGQSSEQFIAAMRKLAVVAAREAPDYRVARGCLPMAPDAEPSEVVIRRFRGG